MGRVRPSEEHLSGESAPHSFHLLTAKTHDQKEVTMKSQISNRHTDIVAIPFQPTFHKDDGMKKQSFNTLKRTTIVRLAALIFVLSLLGEPLFASPIHFWWGNRNNPGCAAKRLGFELGDAGTSNRSTTIPQLCQGVVSKSTARGRMLSLGDSPKCKRCNRTVRSLSFSNRT